MEVMKKQEAQFLSLNLEFYEKNDLFMEKIEKEVRAFNMIIK